jgi:hypothetical protein
MSTIKRKKTYRRMKPREPMVEGSVDAAETVTHTKYAEIQDDGTTIIKTILESLDSDTSNPSPSLAGQSQTHQDNQYNEPMPDISPPHTPRQRKSRVSIDILSM